MNPAVRRSGGGGGLQVEAPEAGAGTRASVLEARTVHRKGKREGVGRLNVGGRFGGGQQSFHRL